MKRFLSSLAVVAAIMPSMGHAMILDEATVAEILGTRMPPSEVRVGTVDVIYYNSVYFYDNPKVLNLTNRVLDRSIRVDVVRVHPEAIGPNGYKKNAIQNQKSVEEHCKQRLIADKVQNPAGECGSGLVHE